MSNRLYIPPLPNAKAFTSDEGIRAQIQQSGLLQQGGTATEKIAAENVDLVINGRYDYGATFSQKAADELESLGESSYEGVPLYNPDESDSGRNKGYYDVEQVDVSPAQPNTRESFEYTVGLAFKGTKQTHWRAVKTSVEDIQTGLATGSGGLIGIPATASKVRWFDVGEGKGSATVQETVSAEFGDVELYDPTEPSFSEPELIYEVDYSDESPVDVRVFDDRGLSEYKTLSDGTEVKQWSHAFHDAFEFDGRPVVENGLVRLIFDEPNGTIDAYEWNDTGSTWDAVSLPFGDLELLDADIGDTGGTGTGIRPTDTAVYVEFEDTTNGDIERAVLRFERGIDGVIVRFPPGGATTQRVEDLFDPVASTQTTDAQPTQALESRGEVK